jgi:hypothetical protein
MRGRHAGFRRLLVGLNLALNLAMLIGSPNAAATWDWAFPLGLSFYGFQALPYTLDL